MGWSSDNEEVPKKGMDLSSKILLAIIACVVVIIMIICMLLMTVEKSSFTISVDGKAINTTTKEALITTIDNKTYINIEEFAKLVGYEYHQGEYKAFTIDKDKCYVQGENETASFYLNDNKVSKLPINKLEEDYREYTIEDTIKSENGAMYASQEAISLAFNTVIGIETKAFDVYTLDYLVTTYDAKVKEWGYTGIAEQSFENQKSLIYGYLIVQKEGGLYKIIDIDNTKEIVSDKYKSIEFVENTKEFFVTNSLSQVGIINLDGTTKIEPVYDTISIFDKSSDLYLIEKTDKYGIVKSGNITIIFPEYDSIGFNNKSITNTSSNQNLILDTLIPVSKSGKWGAFDKDGKKVLDLIYDGFGSSLTTVEVDNVKKVVEPVLSIERCDGIVVKKDNKYGLIDVYGKELVPIAVQSIYGIENAQSDDEKYFMLYNDKELNVIERLITAGLIEDTTTNNKIEAENETNTSVNEVKDTVQTSANVTTNNSTVNGNTQSSDNVINDTSNNVVVDVNTNNVTNSASNQVQ